MRARITVYPRREVLDPQGKAIREALRRVGFKKIDDVRAGKSFELELAVDDAEKARSLAQQMCEKLLANTVVEEFEIEISEESIE